MLISRFTQKQLAARVGRPVDPVESTRLDISGFSSLDLLVLLASIVVMEARAGCKA